MPSVRHIALRCRDVEVTRRFYAEVLGMRFVDYRGSGPALDMSYGYFNLTLLPHDGERPPVVEGEEYIHFGLVVDDLQETWRRVRAWGADAPKTVKGRVAISADEPPSVAFKACDPDGNVLDITSDEGEWRI